MAANTLNNVALMSSDVELTSCCPDAVVNGSGAAVAGHYTALPNPEVPKDKATVEKPRLYRMADLLLEWEAEAQASHQAFLEKRPRGPVSGIAKLDRDLGGAFSPGLHIVHGQPGTGKTAFGLQVAAECGVPSLFVTCEMSALELLRRHTARVTGTFLGRLKSGELSPEQSLALARQGALSAPHLALLDATRTPAPWEFLRDCAEIVRAQCAQSGSRHFLIIVDSLHAWVEGAWPGAQEYEALNFGLARLRQLAHETSSPLVLMCERNRESMRSGGQSAGAGTRKIEYGAETVIELENDPLQKENVHGEKNITLRLSKNRHGAAGQRTELLFNGALQKFITSST
jgi:replicative DNA helicase